MDPPASRRSDRIAARTEPDNMPVNDDPADLQTHEETTSPRQDEQAPAFDVNEAGERERALVDAVRAYLHREGQTQSSGALSPELVAYVEGMMARTRLSGNATDPPPATARADTQSAPLPSRVKMLAPEKFKGARTDVERFERATERYVHASNIETSVMTLLPSLLANEAETWYNAMERSGELATNWEDFKLQLRERFDDPAAVRKARDKLDRLTLDGSVAKLRREMEAVLIQIPTMSVEDQIDKFMKKTSLAIRHELEMHPPSTLQDAFRLAERVELADAAAKGKVVPDDGLSSERGRGKRGQGRGRGQGGASSSAPFGQGSRGSAPWQGGGRDRPPPMGLAAIGAPAAPGNVQSVVAEGQPAHTTQTLVAVQQRQQNRPNDNAMSQDDLNRCSAEWRCYWCKVSMPDAYTRHQQRNCPLRLSGKPPVPMPAPSTQTQDVRSEGNGSGRWRQ